MRRKVLIVLGALIAAPLLLVAAGSAVALWNAPTMRQEGDAVVITNPGLAIRGAEIGLQIGRQATSTVRLDEVPRGETRLPITRFDPSWRAGGPPAEGGSLSGSRMGVSWTYYWALRLAAPARPTPLAGAGEAK